MNLWSRLSKNSRRVARRPWLSARAVEALTSALPPAFHQRPAHSREIDASSVNLLEWSRRFLPSHFSKPSSTMHRWLADRLDDAHRRRGQKINLIGPRGAAKSTVGALAGVLRSAVEGKDRYIWIVSDTKSQAQSHLENVKVELVENGALAQAYPSATGKGPRWRAAAIELPNGVVIEAFGTGQRLRGRRRRHYRPSLIVCDDLQNNSHIASARQREASRIWFHGTLMKAGNRRTNILNLATALHREALALELHALPGWISSLFPSVMRWPDESDLWEQWKAIYCDSTRPDAMAIAQSFYDARREKMDRGAQVLWPEEESLYDLMRMRIESGVTAFEREKQGSPVDPERCEWPESYFEDSIWFDDWPKDLCLKTLSLDPSKGTDARHGDYSALVMLGVDLHGVLYVEADLDRRPTSQMVADGVARYLQFRPDAFGVEVNQWQELLATEFVAEFQRQGALGVTPYGIHNQIAKTLRIRRLGPYLSQRRIRFRCGSPSTELLVNQLRDFPLAAHDDGPDALEMALRLAEEVWKGRREARGDPSNPSPNL